MANHGVNSCKAVVQFKGASGVIYKKLVECGKHEGMFLFCNSSPFLANFKLEIWSLFLLVWESIFQISEGPSAGI